MACNICRLLSYQESILDKEKEPGLWDQHQHLKLLHNANHEFERLDRELRAEEWRLRMAYVARALPFLLIAAFVVLFMWDLF